MGVHGRCGYGFNGVGGGMQFRRLIIIGGIIAILIGISAGAYIWYSGGSGEASQDISSEQLTTTNSEQIVFHIVAEESEVRFILNEVLRGVPTTVTGRTNQVAGDIAVDFETPTESEVGSIRVNVRTMLTDNEFRNRAIRGQILQSARDEFEFSEFKPTALEGLPETVTMGEAFSFKLSGDLTVRDITKPVTFDITVTPVSEERLEGTAVATVQRGDYNLTIPSAPGVADVSEDVRLEIDFVALTGSNEATPEAST
jgi:polyisoprenoid-binding protein YceI